MKKLKKVLLVGLSVLLIGCARGDNSIIPKVEESKKVEEKKEDKVKEEIKPVSSSNKEVEKKKLTLEEQATNIMKELGISEHADYIYETKASDIIARQLPLELINEIYSKTKYFPIQDNEKSIKEDKKISFMDYEMQDQLFVNYIVDDKGELSFREEVIAGEYLYEDTLTALKTEIFNYIDRSNVIKEGDVVVMNDVDRGVKVRLFVEYDDYLETNKVIATISRN